MASSSTTVKSDTKTRRAQNLIAALNAVEAGIAIMLVGDDKRPLWPMWQRHDTEISNSAKLAAATKTKALPAHFGSTRSPDEVRRLFRIFPDAMPAACAGLNGLLVVDVDTKRDGVKNLDAWLQSNGHVLPVETPITITQSGGRHLVFADPDAHGNAAGGLAALGCDVRGRAGYFVLPGSVRANGASYVQASEAGLLSAFALGVVPPLPTFFSDAIAAKSSASTSTNDKELAPLLAELSEADLEGEARFDASELTSSGNGGDRSSWRLSMANRMAERHRDVTVADYLATLLAAPDRAGTFVDDDRPSEGEFNSRNVARDWMQAIKRRDEADTREARLEKAFGRAWDGPVCDALSELQAALDTGAALSGDKVLAALKEAGAKNIQDVEALFEALNDPLDERSPEEMFDAIETATLNAADRCEAVEHQDAPKQTKRSLITLDTDAARAWQPIDWIVDGLIPRGSLGIAFGPPSSYKSFVTLHFASCVARGLECFGRRVEKTGVLFWYGEGAQGIAGRFKAWGIVNGADGGAVGLADAPLDFTTADRAEKTLRKMVGEYRQATGVDCELIVLDTVSKAFIGIDENSNSEVAKALRYAELAVKRLGVTLLFVAHVGKDGASRGVRGASVFEANVDFRLQFSRGQFWVERMKDGRIAPPIVFTMSEVEIGKNKYAEPVMSLCVGRWGIGSLSATGEGFGAVDDEVAESIGRLSSEQRAILDAAYAAIDANNGTAAPLSIVSALPHMKSDTVRKTLAGRLRKDGLLKRFGDSYRRPSEEALDDPE